MSDIISLLVAIASLVVAIASLAVSKEAAAFAKQSLDEAKRVADRDSLDWRQRKWFDLYYEADRAYDTLDEFQAQYSEGPPPKNHTSWEGYAEQVNSISRLFRRVHSMAAVFPQNPVVSELFRSTDFSEENELLSAQRKRAVFDAVQNIRDKALIKNIDILGG
jgi:hypothetical protein